MAGNVGVAVVGTAVLDRVATGGGLPVPRVRPLLRPIHPFGPAVDR
jgi:hypothetical protein